MHFILALMYCLVIFRFILAHCSRRTSCMETQSFTWIVLLKDRKTNHYNLYVGQQNISLHTVYLHGIIIIKNVVI
jgi:hypothetical protein